MNLTVAAPLRGTVIDLRDIPDPVFSGGLVGQGLALVPDITDSCQVLAPADGEIIKVFPHAFIIKTTADVAVLVHLGLDTAELKDSGYITLSQQGTHVQTGTPLLRWSPRKVSAAAASIIVPIIAMDCSQANIITLAGTGNIVAPGDALFEVR